MKDVEKALNDLKNKSVFTEELTLVEYVESMCRRYARIYGEILNTRDLDTVYVKLQDKGLIGA